MLFVPEMGLRNGGLVSSLFSHRLWRASRNENPNSGGETNTTGWVARSSGTLQRITSNKFTGAACIEVTTAANTLNSGANSPISADGVAVSGDVWTLSARVLVPAGVDFRVVIGEVSSAGSTLAESFNVYTGTGNWQQVSVSRTFNQGTVARLKAAFVSNTNAQASFVILVDDINYEKQPTPSPHIATDGAAANRVASRLSLAA